MPLRRHLPAISKSCSPDIATCQWQENELKTLEQDGDGYWLVQYPARRTNVQAPTWIRRILTFGFINDNNKRSTIVQDCESKQYVLYADRTNSKTTDQRDNAQQVCDDRFSSQPISQKLTPTYEHSNRSMYEHIIQLGVNNRSSILLSTVDPRSNRQQSNLDPTSKASKRTWPAVSRYFYHG